MSYTSGHALEILGSEGLKQGRGVGLELEPGSPLNGSWWMGADLRAHSSLILEEAALQRLLLDL